jgi:putative ABC transport system substrate-binding protein
MQFGQLRRREFITLIGGAAAAWPGWVCAQQGTLRRIGFLYAAVPVGQTDSDDPGRGFMQGMHELGYLEGRDFVVEWRSAEASTSNLSTLLLSSCD